MDVLAASLGTLAFFRDVGGDVGAGSERATRAMLRAATVEEFNRAGVVVAREGDSDPFVRVVLGGDGQVSLGQTIVKGNARKVRRLAKGAVIGGFAGATADAFTLFERLEAKLAAGSPKSSIFNFLINLKFGYANSVQSAFYPSS